MSVKSLLTVPVLSLTLATVTPAATIVNDTFADGDRTSTTPAGSATPKTSIPWYLSNTSSAALAVVNSDADFGGNYLRLDVTADNITRIALGTFAGSGVTLGVGDELILDFDFKNYYFYNVARAIGFAIHDTGANAVNTDGTSNGADNKGYGFLLPGTANTGGRFIENADANIFAGTSMGDFTVIEMDETTDKDALQHATLTLTRSAASQLDLKLELTSAVYSKQTFTASDTSGIVTTFNEILFGTSKGSSGQLGEVAIDNVKVEYIPEPSALALLSLAAIPMLRRRRA